MLRDDGNKFVGSASANPLESASIFLSCFTAMSIASGQFFLNRINSELNSISKKLDEIINLLNIEREEDLKSKINTVYKAYNSYEDSINDEALRYATLDNLFRINEAAETKLNTYKKLLDKQSKKTIKKIDENSVVYYYNGIKLSCCLYVLGNLVEILYSKNNTSVSLKKRQEEIKGIIERSQKETQTYFGRIQKKDLKKFEKKLPKLNEIINREYENNNYCEFIEITDKFINNLISPKYYISSNNELYYEI